MNNVHGKLIYRCYITIPHGLPLTREGLMDEIGISILKNVAKKPNQPIRKAFEGIAAKERTLYRHAAALEQNKYLKFDTSEPGKILVRITGLGKLEITGRVEQAPMGGETP